MNAGNQRLYFIFPGTGTYKISAHCGEEYSKAIKLEVFDIDKIEHKNTSNSENYYEIQSNEIVFKNERFSYKAIVNGTPPPNKIHWDMWKYDGLNQILATGIGTNPTMRIINTYDNCRITFYYDSNSNFQHDTGEYNVSSNYFNVREVKSHTMTGGVSSKVGTPIKSVSSLLSLATYHLQKKDSASDFRAATSYSLSGTQTSIPQSTHDPVGMKEVRDLLGKLTGYDDFRGNKAYFNNQKQCVIVDRIELFDTAEVSTGGTAAGVSDNNVKYKILISDGFDGKTMAHEIGHSVGLGHYSNDSNNIMFNGSEGNLHSLTRTQSLSFE